MITRAFAVPVRRSTRNAISVPSSGDLSVAPSANDEFDMNNYLSKSHEYEKTENHSADDVKVPFKF